MIWKVTPLYFGASKGALKIFARNSSRHNWQLHKKIPIVLGRNGISSSLSYTSLPPFWGKQEGDGKTPSGTFHINSLFSKHVASPGVQWPYHLITQQSRWIDHPWHPRYNHWSNSIPLGEQMDRQDGLYREGMNLNYNQNPTLPYKGSAIFIHQWKNANRFTSGCIAMSAEHLDYLWHQIATLTPNGVAVQISPYP